MNLTRRLCFLYLYFWSFVAMCDAICTWPSEFRSTTWRSNRHGALAFSETTMEGWPFTVDGQTRSTWQCTNVDSFQNDGYLMMRSVSNFTKFVTSYYWAYLCISLKKVTENSYRYYVEEPPQAELGNERFRMLPNATLSTKTDLCLPDHGAVGSEYGVLIRTGTESSVSITCPWTSLGRYDYSHIPSESVATCSGAGDSWNMCADNTKITFNVVSCSTNVVYASGSVSCIDSVSGSTESYVTVYNSGTVDNSTTFQFVCFAISVDMTTASVAPGYCRKNQTASQFPVDVSTGNKIGAMLRINNTYESCSICQVPQSPYGGNVTILKDGAVTVAFYACAPNYTLNGDAQRTCQDNNTWSGEEPTCVCKSGDSLSVCDVSECHVYNYTDLPQCCKTCADKLKSPSSTTPSTTTSATAGTASTLYGNTTNAPAFSSTTISESSVGSGAVTKETVSENVCPLFEASGGCGQGLHCENQAGKPVCVLNDTKDTADKTVVITVASVCSTVFLVLVVVGVIFLLRRYRGKRQDSARGSAIYINTTDI